MVVNDLSLRRSGIRPDEADAVRAVHANAPLPLAVAPELLEQVARRDAKILQRAGDLELAQLSQGNALEGDEAPPPAAPRQAATRQRP